ncbi:MAG TPA: monomethylamine:corrinoid methyltransferase [Bacillota bacterium]
MSRLFAQVAGTASRMGGDDVSRLVHSLLGLYEGSITARQSPVGLTFDEMYDPEALTPRPEHQTLYSRARDELAALGLKLPD